MAKLHLTCREATELLSRGLDQPLGRPERMALWLHLIICRGCSHFGRNLRVLRDRIVTGVRAGTVSSSAQMLSAAARARIGALFGNAHKPRDQ